MYLFLNSHHKLKPIYFMKQNILIVLILMSNYCEAQKLIMDILDPTGANQELQSGKSQTHTTLGMFLTDWQLGYLYYGSKKERKTLRYNAYKDVVHLKDEKNREMIIEKGQIEAFSIVDNNKEYNFKWVTDIPKINFGYLQKIYEGKVKVYYRHSRKIRQSVSQTEGYAGNNTDEQFVSDDAFVIELPNKVKHLTNARKKEVLAIFADKKKEIEEFIKSKKLDTQKLSDLIEIVQKYETLIGE